jgi:DNA-binding SARP family transcriptional activator
MIEAWGKELGRMSETLVVMPDELEGQFDAAGLSTIELFLLRGFELRCDGQTVLLLPGSQRLVAFLALHDRHLLRTYVAETLWPDVPDRRAWGNLRSALWRLGGLRDRVVEQAGDHLQLCPQVIIDVREAERMAALLIAGSPTGGQPFDQRIFEGELLPGWFDEWILSERERHRQLGLHALELLCEHLTLEGRYCQAVQAGLAATNAEPLRESAHRTLICAYLAEGNVSEAIRQYQAFEQLIKKELGLEPSDQLQTLIAQPCAV